MLTMYHGDIPVLFGLYRYYRHSGAAPRAKNAFLLILIACTAALLAPAAIGAENLRIDSPGQPQSLDYTGVYTLRQIDPNLTGTGVKFAVVSRSITYIDGHPQNDYRPDIRHNCFAQSQFTFKNFEELPAGTSPHSTAICSILFGSDPNASCHELGQFHYQGIAPNARADIFEFWHFLISSVFPASPPDADILTAGIGNQFEDWWTRGIESMAEHHGLIIVAGIGNGARAYDPPLYPAAGANVIGVGVVDSVNTQNIQAALANFSLAYPDHSSYGPTADGRCKPDIVAPGNCLAADTNNPNGYAPTGNYSSFSTPLVAGTAALLVQTAKQNPGLADAISFQAGNCVIKAILLNSADKMPYWHKGNLAKDDDHHVPLDHLQGAGILNAVNAYKQLTAGQNGPENVPETGWDNNLLQKNKTFENLYKITLPKPVNKIITATLVWNRHYQNIYPFEPIPQKDANLRLQLWAVDPDNRENDRLIDFSDSPADNLEHIYCRTDANYTDYEIVVTFSDIDDPNLTDTPQQYALAWNVTEETDIDKFLWCDLNADGIVNEMDSLVLANYWLAGLKTPQAYLFGDINDDGTIDPKDFQVLFDNTNRRADWYTVQDPTTKPQ